MEVNVLVLSGDGINCENEMALAFNRLGANTQTIELNQLIKDPEKLKWANILAFPGGFSYGDEIHSGQVFALKIKRFLLEHLQNYINENKLIIGVCNGFQVLVKLGLLPNPFEQRCATLTQNSGNNFVDRWEKLEPQNSVCIWTRGLNTSIEMPARHGEGRLIFAGDANSQQEIYKKLLKNKQVVFTYKNDINGSFEKIAGLTDPSGKILGLMPHPEAALEPSLNPLSNNCASEQIFKNAINYIKQQQRI